ncbi:MAG: Fe-S cluster assembly protein SufD, partial [Thermodesulfobacteriota bacterium]
SKHSNLPQGVVVKNLADAIESEQEILKDNLAKYADFKEEAFTALNTAFMEDGGFVYIPKGTVVETPIHLLFISTDEESPSITNPRNLIIAEDNCEANVIEHYASMADNVYLSNVVTEIVVGENSTIGHYMIELESKKSFNISTLRVQQARSSNINSHSLLLGGSLVRNNVHPVLAGEGCDSLISGLYMPNHRQHMDNHMIVEHASPHCDSRQLYNGILDGRSRAVFHGRIIVHEDAQKTDAKQTNRNLLLSDTAQVDTKPQLEIYADDVKCTHGATIGQMDENALFYLRSRGISKSDARDIIMNAFTNETFETMAIDSVKNYCVDLVADWFNQRKQDQVD